MDHDWALIAVNFSYDFSGNKKKRKIEESAKKVLGGSEKKKDRSVVSNSGHSLTRRVLDQKGNCDHTRYLKSCNLNTIINYFSTSWSIPVSLNSRHNVYTISNTCSQTANKPTMVRLFPLP